MLDEGSPRYQRKANALARSYVRIKQCKKCGDPRVDGYCCASCGDDGALHIMMQITADTSFGIHRVENLADDAEA